MVKKITKEAEQQLITALNQVADLTNDGADPNEAISKVASEQKIPHGHIQLLVNAYNTGRTTAQRHSSDDVWSKAAEFPLADASKILEKVYPTNVKSAAQQYSETAIADEYKYAPGWVARKEATLVKKAEGLNWKLTDKKPEPYPKEDREFEKAKGEIKRAEHEVSEAKYRAAYTFDMAVRLKDEVKELLKVAGAPAAGDVYKNAVTVHGKMAEDLFKQIAAEDRSIKLEKRAARLQPARGPVYKRIAECVEACAAYRILREDYETKEAQLGAFRENVLRPFVDPAKKPVAGNQESALVGSSSKEAGFWSGFIGDKGEGTGVTGYLKNRPKKEPPDPSKLPTISRSVPGLKGTWGQRLGALIDTSPATPWNPAKREALQDVRKDHFKKLYKSKYDPSGDEEFNATLAGLQQESLLADLLANDDVVSHYNPHEVLQTYSSLREIAPRAAANRETLRALLRDRLARGGATSTMELDALTKIEKNLRSIESGRYGKDDDDK